MQFSQGHNPIRTRMSNHGAILRMIYRYGPIKRSELAARLGLTLPTITGCVNAMLAAGLVCSTEQEEGSAQALGRPAQVVDLIPGARLFLGVEMRDDCRAVCVTDYRGKVLYRCRDDSFLDGYERNIRSVCELIRRAAAEGPSPLEGIAGLGCCVPGLVDTERGVLEVNPHNDWRDRPVRADLAALTGYAGPISVENNVCARAAGAQLFRRELLNDYPSFAYMFVARGIACPLILNDVRRSGSVVGDGEVGHMVVDPNGPLCSCGERGCLETFSSDQAVLAACRESLGDGAPDTMDGVLLAQERGVIPVQRAVDKALRMLGIALTNITNYSSPRAILIEGKLFRSPANREALLANICCKRYGVSRKSGPAVFFIDADEYSGAVGGAAVAVSSDLERGGA